MASDELVEVKLGATVIDPSDVEAGTGFYEKRFAAGEVDSDLGSVRVKKIDGRWFLVNSNRPSE